MADKQETLVDKTVRDKRGHLALAQWPNLPLAIWIASVLVAMLLHGGAAKTVRLAGDVSLLVWALLEIFRGVNYFRRALGAVVLIGLVLMFVRTL